MLIAPVHEGLLPLSAPIFRLAVPVGNQSEPVYYYRLQVKTLPELGSGENPVQVWAYEAKKDAYLYDIPYNIDNTAGAALLPGKSYAVEVDFVLWERVNAVLRDVRRVSATFRVADP